MINVSGGQFSPSGTAHPILADAVRACAASGVLIVAAAGNQGCDCLHIPGALPSVLAVGAMDAGGNPLPFSNWGDVYESQGILAPAPTCWWLLPLVEPPPVAGRASRRPLFRAWPPCC